MLTDGTSTGPSSPCYGVGENPKVGRRDLAKAFLMEWVGPVPELQWLSPEEGGWGVPLLDLRKSAAETTAVTSSREIAELFVQLQDEDGQFLRGQSVEGPELPCDLRYPTDGPLQDGILFTAAAMEDKWALYHYDRHLYAIRSWTGKLCVVADTRQEPDALVLTRVRGDMGLGPEMLVRSLDFLIRSHVLGQPFPAPLEGEPDLDTPLRYFSLFGRRAQCASLLPPVAKCPPLRSISLLHLACVRDQGEQVENCVARGFSLEAWAKDGKTPLQWAVVGGSGHIVRQMLRLGAKVDGRGSAGDTPLMTAVETERSELVDLLLELEAEAHLSDSNGFTALHRAAEMNQPSVVARLVRAGADPQAASFQEGITPIDLAATPEIAALLRS